MSTQRLLRRLRLFLPLAALVLASPSGGFPDGISRPAVATAAAGAQIAPPPLEPASTGGIAALDRALARLATHRRLLAIAAHPDDEDTALLTLVARGQGGEAAYLSLSRGEGGQNLIGPELGVALGLLRSRELLAARRVDGARQYFTRAYDFGYTRSLEETFARWPREALLEDAARVARRFRPQVIMATFPPDERAGHGQHQASGVVAAEILELAGDPEAFPDLRAEGLRPWRPLAYYRSGWFDRDAEALEYPLGLLDPLTGKSIFQLSRASRSMHRSQDMGSLQELGSGNGRLIPAGGVATSEGGDPFAGIDTRLPALAASLPVGETRRAVETRLAAVEALATEARNRLAPARLAAAAANLGAILEHLAAARATLAEADDPETATAALGVEALLREKVEIAEEALATALGLVPDAGADRETVVPGESLRVTARLWNGGSMGSRVKAVEILADGGWTVSPVPAPEVPDPDLAPGELAEWSFEVSAPSLAPPTAPYFLRRPLHGDLYDWSATPAEVRGEAFGPPVLTARFLLGAGGGDIELLREVVYRFADQAQGEVRRPLRVVPRLEVTAEPELLVWPVAGSARRTVEVEVASNVEEPLAGRVVARVPEGWPEPPSAPFTLAGRGDRQAVVLSLSPPPALATGRYPIRVEAVLDGGGSYAAAHPLVEYEHITPTPRPRPAVVEVSAGDIRLPELERVGYIRGASDRVPEALLAVGVPLEVLSAADLARDLSAFDAIVVGSRAYEIDPALVRANPRLLEYARRGGLLLVQYQQYQFVRGGFAPYPLDIARPHDRVTDETAAVRPLQPAHPALTTPNALGEGDWRGWVQERGLYFAHTWDAAYTPLLAMADPGGPELSGGLLVAPLGEGLYVYTGLAFFRQLPAGVPGAYRLFANLLALGGGGRGEER